MSKYHNQKVYYKGELFDSQGEYNRWRELLLLQKAGAISNLRRQVTFELIPAQYEPPTTDSKGRTRRGRLLERKCTYVADFVYRDGSKSIVEDYKGVQTEVFKIKRKLMLWRYGIEVKITQ